MVTGKDKNGKPVQTLKGGCHSNSAAGSASLEAAKPSRLKARERESLVAALAKTGGKIFIPDGAAALLKMKPTTQALPIKVLGLPRKQSEQSPRPKGVNAAIS